MVRFMMNDLGLKRRAYSLTQFLGKWYAGTGSPAVTYTLIERFKLLRFRL